MHKADNSKPTDQKNILHPYTYTMAPKYLCSRYAPFISLHQMETINRMLHDKSPYIFEDGNQTRDFIHVEDVAQANLNALEHNNTSYKAINIGTGKSTTIKNLAETLTKLYNKQNLNTLTKEHL